MIVGEDIVVSITYNYFSNGIPDNFNYITKGDLNIVPGTNLYDKSTMNTPNIGINNVGVVGSFSGWILAKIPVKENTTYSYIHPDGVYLPASVGMMNYVNVSGGTISSVSQLTLLNAIGLGGKTFTTPSGCTQLWINVKTIAGGTFDYVNTFQLQ